MQPLLFLFLKKILPSEFTILTNLYFACVDMHIQKSSIFLQQLVSNIMSSNITVSSSQQCFFSADRQNHVLISIPNDCLTESASIEWISTLHCRGKHHHNYLLQRPHQQINSLNHQKYILLAQATSSLPFMIKIITCTNIIRSGRKKHHALPLLVFFNILWPTTTGCRVVSAINGPVSIKGRRESSDIPWKVPRTQSSASRLVCIILAGCHLWL